MSKTLLILLFAALCSLHASPQAISPVRIMGHITDKDTQQPLENATVTLLYAKDSSRAASSFTDKNGAFILNARPGPYQLHIAYIGYQQQLKAVTVPASTLADLGTITLQKTGITLGMVEIVEIRTPMVIKKDTLEFNADYYKTRENALMEELLKKLPGIEIDKDGNIKVNGEPVKRILVDGKPFFGDDPKLAIRNLPADMINKIQLIDRKSDQAQFSGANDSKTEKTINITVKQEKQNRFLGRLSGGYGTDKRFAANASLSRFGAHPLSFLGGGNNINGVHETGMLTGGAGITRSWNGGVNYSTDLNSALKVSGSYFMNNLNAVTQRSSARQNFLLDTTYYYNQSTNGINNSTNHMSELRVEYKPDTMHTLIAAANGGYLKSNDSQENTYESLGSQKQLINKGSITNLNHNASPNINGSIFLGKRFKKTGRTLSLTMLAGYSTSTQQQFNRSHNLFIQPDGEMLLDTIDQRNNTKAPHRLLSASITYTEPLNKDHFLDITYTYTHDKTFSEKKTYDFNAVKGIYDSLNDSLSNSFRNTTTLQQGSMAFRTQKQAYDYSIGLLVQSSDLNNNNVSDGSRLQKRTRGFFPLANFNYAFNNNRRLRVLYAGNVQPPDVTLLQPVPNNSNPLYIQLGNPDLKQANLHYAGISYNSVNPATFSNLLINVNATLTSNKTIMATWLDSLGRQVSQPVNANGAYTLGFIIANTFPLNKKQASIKTSTTFMLNRDINYTNGIPGNVKNIYAGQTVTLNYMHKQVFDGFLRASLNYNGARYSQQKENNINLFTYNLFLNGNITLPFSLNAGAAVNYQNNAGITNASNVEVIMINAFITKSIFKHKQGLIKLQGFDLLNRNQGYTRTVGANYVEDVQANVLKRFFLFSFTYFLL